MSLRNDGDLYYGVPRSRHGYIFGQLRDEPRLLFAFSVWPRSVDSGQDFMKINQVQQAFFYKLTSLLEEAGVSEQQLFDELARRGITNPLEIEGVDAMKFLETAVHLSQDPCLMIRLGQQLGIAAYGSFGFALMSCENVRESIQLLLRYGQVLIRPIWSVSEHEGALLIRPEILVGTSKQRQLIAEVAFSNLMAIARSLYGSAVARAETSGLRLYLNYPRPGHSDCYRKAFKTPVTFEAERNELSIPSEVLDVPVRTANRKKHIVFQQQCEEMLRGLVAVDKTTAAVRQLLIQSAGRFLSISEVADRLHISERTLRRRLDDESTSFRAIVDEIRDLLARDYLTKTELTIADIAYLLDYAETVSFRRAFVRWNAMTPSVYRKIMRRSLVGSH